MLMSCLIYSGNTLAQENDSIWFTIDEAKQLLKDAELGLVCDSLLINRALKIVELERVIDVKDEQIRLGGDVIQKQSNKLKKSNKKIDRLRWLGWGLGTIAAVEALILALIIF